MIKLELSSYEKITSYDAKIVQLITTKYKKRIRKNEIHVPLAAKLILVDKNEKLKELFLSFPIINSNNKGNIMVWTDLKLENILKSDWIKKQNLKDLKHKVKILNKKEKIGLTIIEIMEKSNLESKLELYILKTSKYTSMKG